MILIELAVNFLKFACYGLARFIVWVITARDCKHCKYGVQECGYACDEYVCLKAKAKSETTYEYYKIVQEYRDSITRKCFERKK